MIPANMGRLIVQLSLLTCAFSAFADSASPVDVVSFYPGAAAETQMPHPPAEMHIVCQKPSKSGSGLLSLFSSRYLSLLADKSGKILIAAYSQRPETDPATIFDSHHNPHSQDWAYVWDRNGDGRVDYIAAYQGVNLVFLGNELPAGFPRGKSLKMDKDQVNWLRAHVKMNFYHAADDNFDGKVDAAIYPYHDSETPMWVKGFAVLRSGHFDDKFDDNWVFQERIEERLGPVRGNEQGFHITVDPDASVSPKDVMSTWTDLMKDINSAAQSCQVIFLLRQE